MMRTRLARRLRKWAHRLDPSEPTYTIQFDSEANAKLIHQSLLALKRKRGGGSLGLS